MKSIPQVLGLSASLLTLCTTALPAASHSDAPTIKQDPQANITDVYAFMGDYPIGGKALNVVVHVRPFSEPGDGVMYERFADDAQYSIHITEPATGKTIVRYDFTFSKVNGGYKNPNTIIQYGVGTEVGPIQTLGDARQNYTQTYRVERTAGFGRTKEITFGPLIVPPPNVGIKTTPLYNDANGKAVSGATTAANLDSYTKQGVYRIKDNITVFCGPRDDGFYADTPAIFDLLAPRFLDNNGTLANGLGQDGNGVDGFKGYNVLAYGLQIPLEELTRINGYPKVGVYASVSRRNRTYRAGEAKASGPWTQVNRMGNPLFNEVLVASADKDRYNSVSPERDAAVFAKYALTSELASLVNTVYGTSFVSTGRTDLRDIYIPDVLRVDTSTEAVRLSGQSGFSRLSFLGGDKTANGTPSGWPNGRRFGDDVVDIALTAIANGPAYTAPLTPVGDNVTSNDLPFNQVFPYSATPHAGPTNRKDPVAVVAP
jgi:hypothetical protein